jgi:DNA-binding NarL/FixJ family response regulator
VAELELLTDRERRILSLMALGLSNREIAERVYLSEGTVKWHTNKIFKKLGVQSRTQAVMKALEAGLDRDKIR